MMKFALWTSRYEDGLTMCLAMLEKGLSLEYMLVPGGESLCAPLKVVDIPLRTDRLARLVGETAADCILLVSFGNIIPAEWLAEKLFLNIHNSLLPRYRGLHAFTWALINGEKEVGYTLHKVSPAVDGGDIIAQMRLPVSDDDTSATLFARGKETLPPWAADRLVEFSRHEISPWAQDETLATYVCKRRPSDGVIQWRQPAAEVRNFIRALAPPYTPGAFSYYHGSRLYIPRASTWNMPENKGICGQIIMRADDGVLVKCLDTALYVDKIIVDGQLKSAGECFPAPGARLADY